LDAEQGCVLILAAQVRRVFHRRKNLNSRSGCNLEGRIAEARSSPDGIDGRSFVPPYIFQEKHLMARLISTNVGLPRDVAWRGEKVHTAIWKLPVRGRIAVHRLNVEGDGQGDLAGHGGEHRAVMVYQMDAYRYWETHLGRNDFSFGQFGENFTVIGLPDDEVCVGDRYRIGSALFEVTQPRVTCYRVGIRMAEPEIPALLVSHHRPGFYFRVLEEGEVGADDEITKVADGPEHITVANIDALLYLPNPSREQLQSSLRVPALSPGWKTSLRTLAEQNPSEAGNPGLKASNGPPPAWPGFRPLRVARVDRETVNVVSLSIEQADGAPLPAALPGQFLVLRLRTTPDGPMLLRNYSMSGTPGASTYRISIKRETNGVVSSYLYDHVHAGDFLEVSAPRGGFILRSGDAAVVLLSAGIGATPVLAMLHSLSTAASRRQVWWIYGARNRAEHPFAKESRNLLLTLVNGRSHVVYSKPDAGDEPGVDYDSVGHVDTALLDRLSVTRSADFYLCGPPSFLKQLTQGLETWGVDSTRIHLEVFGPEASITPGIARSSRPPVHAPAGQPGVGPKISFTRSGLTVPWDSRFSSLLEFAEACNVPVQWSCRTGVCHTCECALIGGTVHYEPDPLEPPAAGNVLICCSRPSGDVDVDL
jgi:ferredoxin-NADP reductase/MOSC domain-containing protein YiiM